MCDRFDVWKCDVRGSLSRNKDVCCGGKERRISWQEEKQQMDTRICRLQSKAHRLSSEVCGKENKIAELTDLLRIANAEIDQLKNTAAERARDLKMVAELYEMRAQEERSKESKQSGLPNVPGGPDQQTHCPTEESKNADENDSWLVL
jgi:hypothetical protein